MLLGSGCFLAGARWPGGVWAAACAQLACALQKWQVQQLVSSVGDPLTSPLTASRLHSTTWAPDPDHSVEDLSTDLAIAEMALQAELLQKEAALASGSSASDPLQT